MAASKEPTDVKATLDERGARYGDFTEHAAIAQALQDQIRGEKGWLRLTADKRQALTVICDKIARILNGDPEYDDNWRDIAGYATLVLERLDSGSTKYDFALGPKTKVDTREERRADVLEKRMQVGDLQLSPQLDANVWRGLPPHLKDRYTFDIRDDVYRLKFGFKDTL